MSELGALIPEAGEEERAWFVDQSVLLNFVGDLVPAIEVERRVARGVDQAAAPSRPR